MFAQKYRWIARKEHGWTEIAISPTASPQQYCTAVLQADLATTPAMPHPPYPAMPCHTYYCRTCHTCHTDHDTPALPALPAISTAPGPLALPALLTLLHPTYHWPYLPY